MNVARVAVLGIAVVTAGLAAFLMRNVVSSEGPAEAATQSAALNATKVLVAGRKLGAERNQWLYNYEALSVALT